MNGVVNLVDLFRWLWQRKRVILVTQVLAVTSAIIFTGPHFIAPQFKSYAVVYPLGYNPDSKDASESAIEQLLQYLNSMDIKNAVIKKFNLGKHYGIDTLKRNGHTLLLKEYDGNVTIASTLYLAAEINVFDVSPDTAYKMVNDIIKEVNDKILVLEHEKAKEFEAMYKEQLDMERKNIDSLSAIAKSMSMQFGLMDDGAQAKETERAYYQLAASLRSGKSLDEVSAQIKNMEERGTQYKEVNRHLEGALAEYDATLLNYHNAIKDANKQQTFVNVVSQPYVADQKSYPRRGFLTWLASLSVFISTVVVLMFVERIKL